MKYVEILPYLKKLQVFSVRDLQIIDDKYSSYKVASWVKKGYIHTITRGYYILEETSKNSTTSQIIANTIYKPSYISLETVLHTYGIIPEYPFTITSISTKKTRKIYTDFGNYSYNTVKPDLFWGYDIQKNGKEKILIASLEKAIIDFLYFRKQYKDIQDFRGLRWNREELKHKLDIQKLNSYATIIASPTITKKIRILTDYIQQG